MVKRTSKELKTLVDEAEAQAPAFRKHVSAALLDSLLQQAAKLGAKAADSAYVSGDVDECVRQGGTAEQLVEAYWDGVCDLEILERLEDEANDVWRDTYLRREILAYLFSAGFQPVAQEFVDNLMGDKSSCETQDSVDESSLSVVLVEPGTKRIQVIKVIREIRGLSMKEAKAFVDCSPREVKTGLSRLGADDIAGRLRQVGATAEIK